LISDQPETVDSRESAERIDSCVEVNDVPRKYNYLYFAQVPFCKTTIIMGYCIAVAKTKGGVS